jgi:hypothetical protein
VVDVRLGIDLEVRFVGIIVERIGRKFAAVSRPAAHSVIPWTKLFFKKRMENHCRRAGVLHPFNVVELFRQRRRRWNKRSPQFKSKISSGQFHGNAS